MSIRVTGEQARRLRESLRRNMGPIAMEAMADPVVIDVWLNADGAIWINYLGRGKVDSGYRVDPGNAQLILQDVASMLGVVVNDENPVVEGEFPLDGSRFEGVVPPVVSAPIFAIRKKATKIFTLNDFIQQKVMTPAQVRVLQEAVRDGRNILVVGGTGSGKTTLLNALLDETAKSCPDIRMILIEDTVELQCSIKDMVAMRTSPTKDMTALLRVTMRVSPDRICLGEIRGQEGLALLKAWNSGHSGGFATIHADSLHDGIVKLDEYIQEAGVPSKMRLISRAVHFVVFIEKTEEFGRKVKEVGIVKGYDIDRHEPIIEQIA